MAKELIIHFGMHKTGSSSIQRTLFEQCKNKDVAYLNPGYPNSSGPICSGFLEKPELFHGNFRRGVTEKQAFARSKRFISIIKSQIQENKSKYIISAEDFTRLSIDGFEKFINEVSPYFTKISAIGYVRSPKSYMESFFQQTVKDDELSFLSFDYIYPNYKKQFEKFEIILGKENVTYVKFDINDFENGCLVQDFYSRVDLRINKDDVRRINEGLSLSALKVLWIYRRFGKGYGRGDKAIEENQRILRLLSKIKGEKLRFNQNIINKYFNRYVDDIKWMENRVGKIVSNDKLLSKQDISKEDDLLVIDDVLIKRLKKLFNYNGPVIENNQKFVAHIIDSFRDSLGNNIVDDSSFEKMTDVTIKELVHEIRSGNMDYLENININNMIFIISEILQYNTTMDHFFKLAKIDYINEIIEDIRTNSKQKLSKLDINKVNFIVFEIYKKYFCEKEI